MDQLVELGLACSFMSRLLHNLGAGNPLRVGYGRQRPGGPTGGKLSSLCDHLTWAKNAGEWSTFPKQSVQLGRLVKILVFHLE